MRTCKRCECEMVEGFNIMVERGLYGIQIFKENGAFAKAVAKPKLAICPECGEISFYMDNVDEILKDQ